MSYLKVTKLLDNVPAGHLPYQDVPPCCSLVNNLQDMLKLGAVILLCVVSHFLLPNSSLLSAMKRCGGGSQEGNWQCGVAQQKSTRLRADLSSIV